MKLGQEEQIVKIEIRWKITALTQFKNKTHNLQNVK